MSVPRPCYTCRIEATISVETSEINVTSSKNNENQRKLLPHDMCSWESLLKDLFQYAVMILVNELILSSKFHTDYHNHSCNGFNPIVGVAVV